MSQPFQRILDLVKRTGDRLIVTDPDGQHAYVVMDLDQYEALLEQKKPTLQDFVPEEALLGDFDEELETTHLPSPSDSEEKIPEDIRKAVEHDLAIIQSWEQEHEKKVADLSQKKDDGGTDEERFYLEPIE